VNYDVVAVSSSDSNVDEEGSHMVRILVGIRKGIWTDKTFALGIIGASAGWITVHLNSEDHNRNEVFL